MRQKIHLVAVGDVFIDRGLSEDPFLHVKETFREADIVFGNLEGAYTEHTDRAPSAGVPLVAHPKMAASLLNAGFTHLSLANNHILDAGHQGLVDTIRLLECRGIIPLGAGISLSHAHSAAITEVSGCRVGLLAYTCVFPRGYEARAAVPGVAAIRGRELYSAWEQNEWNPGLVPRIEIIPDENDLVRLRSGIETLSV